MKSNLRVAFALVMLCFFVSGVAGLVYQVAWARYLALFLGHTSYAVIAVLVAFMGGLALGNAALGAVADKVRRPLRLYAWLELGIAVYAMLFPSYYEVCHHLYISAARHFAASGAPLLVLKFAFSLLTILLPTTLMGATFPALTCFVTQSLAELRERVAALYFINSLGAVAGCFVADFWWIPTHGIEFTVFGGAILNFLAGLVALALSVQMIEGRDSAALANRNIRAPSDEYFSALDLKVATWAIGLSGFVAMLYEVAWTRVLALALGSSTHAFSIMLVTFISGIAVGAAIIARWKSLKRTMEAFGWAESALALAVFVSMFTYDSLPYWFVQASWMLGRHPGAYPFYELIQGLICFIVMFVPAVCLGMTLPLASRIATAELAKTGRSVGRIFAVNTAGTVFGAAITGLVFMPKFGLAATFAIGVAINAMIGAAILRRNLLTRVHPPLIGTTILVAVGFVALWSHFAGPVWRATFAQGIWRVRGEPQVALLKRQRGISKLQYCKDGAGSTVTVVSDVVRGVTNLSLRVNGKADASSGDTGTQLLVGHLPCLYHTTATNSLLVGLGSGMTGGALLRHTNLLSVQCVEISPEVREAAGYFKEYNDDVLHNPRFHLALDDAKSFLNISSAKYDVIVNEPSNPWMAGVAAVFSREFYENCAEHLATNGVMVQWVQSYETDDATMQSVIKTFASVFPHVSLWQAQPTDLILIGTLKPRAINADAFVNRMADARVHEDLARAGFAEPLVLLSHQIVSEKNCAFLPTADIPIHSDFFPTLEFQSQKGFFVGERAKFYEDFDESKLPRAQTILAAHLKAHPLTRDDFRTLATAFLDNRLRDPRLNFSWMHHWTALEPDSTIPLEMLERLASDRSPAVAEELRLAPRHEWLIQTAQTDIAALQFYERVLMRSYRYKRTALYQPDTRKLEDVLNVLLPRDPLNRRVYNLHAAELAWDKGDDAMCFKFGALGLDPDPKREGPLTFALDELAPRQVLANMIDSALRSGNLKRATDLAAFAVNNKFLVAGEFYLPALDLMCRKVETLAENAPKAKN